MLTLFIIVGMMAIIEIAIWWRVDGIDSDALIERDLRTIDDARIRKLEHKIAYYEKENAK